MFQPKLIYLLCLFLPIQLWAQVGHINDSNMFANQNSNQETTTYQSKKSSKDSLQNPLAHSPKKAMLLSAALPGLGQAYNKKYWKIPVIIAAAGASLYGALWNNKYYQNFREQYNFRVENGYNEDPYYDQFQEPTLRSYRDYYHKNRDLCYILLGATYVLQIIDAGVDAHFYDFTITDNLSLNITPQINFTNNNPSTQLLFCFKF